MPTSLNLLWQGRPTRAEPGPVLKCLAPLTRRYELSAGPRRVHTSAYLDTVDWRLRRRGLVLSHEGDALILDGNAAPRTEKPASRTSWPARIEHLAPGPVRDGVAEAMWIRAVAPKVRTRTVTSEVAVLNEDGKTVARIEWTEATGVEPAKTEPLTRVTVRPLRGYAGDAERVARVLLRTEGFAPADGSLYEDLLHATGLSESAAKPVITPGMPADVAVATALLGFADAIRDNLQGTIDDVDTEFLHDLRVAVRRTRSLLKICGDLLPPRLAQRYAPRFKSVGDLTTPTRDLDVYLLELDDLARSITVGEPGDLDPFGEHLREELARERRALVRGLRSKGFTRMLDGWRDALREVIENGDSPVTARQLAAERIGQVAKRVDRKARAITPESPAEHVHELRKRCKELRYVLEVFKPLCPPETFRAVLKDLKRLQDVLGAFQDGEVQSDKLRVYAKDMLESKHRPPAATLLAMGELLARFVRQQHESRHELTGALEQFLGPKTHARIEELLA
ncbi:CHAD domain-containing protein [Amycolatopsis sp. K13G38]|uniref:CHAD domain-containing protein n=1 Tax=Amycolatopsis acididurans TaxID=2724524 RepID=A0ABX1IX64_9PSEU|nr:CHAD domain-containing protein [Amycolatopsis acididurans]NKQ52039.1 CHAD domain-containing protein [Amycolatopsis acididurans]